MTADEPHVSTACYVYYQPELLQTHLKFDVVLQKSYIVFVLLYAI